MPARRVTRRTLDLLTAVSLLVFLIPVRAADTPPPATPETVPPASAPQGTVPKTGTRPASAKAQTRSIPAQRTPEFQLPEFQPGMWEFRRTMTVTTRGLPQTATVKKCSDPSKDFHAKLDDLKHRGCVFSPTSHTGDSYHLKWSCPAQGGSIIMTDVLTAKGSGGYEDVLESRFGARTTRSVITASRIGSCPSLPQQAPRPAPPKK